MKWGHPVVILLLFPKNQTSFMPSHFLTEVMLHEQDMASAGCQGALQRVA